MVNYDCDTGKFNINHVHYYHYKQTLKQRILKKKKKIYHWKKNLKNLYKP